MTKLNFKERLAFAKNTPFNGNEKSISIKQVTHPSTPLIEEKPVKPLTKAKPVKPLIGSCISFQAFLRFSEENFSAAMSLSKKLNCSIPDLIGYIVQDNTFVDIDINNRLPIAKRAGEAKRIYLKGDAFLFTELQNKNDPLKLKSYVSLMRIDTLRWFDKLCESQFNLLNKR